MKSDQKGKVRKPVINIALLWIHLNTECHLNGKVWNKTERIEEKLWGKKKKEHCVYGY